jgi:hypothetical protein
VGLRVVLKLNAILRATVFRTTRDDRGVQAIRLHALYLYHPAILVMACATPTAGGWQAVQEGLDFGIDEKWVHYRQKTSTQDGGLRWNFSSRNYKSIAPRSY